MKKLSAVLAALVTLSLLSCVSGGASASSGTAAPAAPSAPKPYTGDGGNGISITILPPRGAGLAAEQNYLPDLVANELVSNFRSFSAMTLFDRVNNQKQYDELLSGIYADDDKAGLDLGHLSSTEYMLLGDITKTTTGYTLHLMVNKNSDKTTAAAYSGTCTVAELDNLTEVRRASLELLGKMNVQLTEKAKQELSGAARENAVNAQTALARGITAQRQGTEVTALSYYFQAAAFDTSLPEAARRASVMSADISSGNIGDNVRNDIAWRKAWMERLAETEQFIDNYFKTYSLPFTLFYSTAIRQGSVNYQTETVSLSFDTFFRPASSAIWAAPVEKTLETVFQGLNATGRQKVWGLDNWSNPESSGCHVTNLKPFNTDGKITFEITFELLNDRNQVISSRTSTKGGSWEWSKGKIIIKPKDRGSDGEYAGVGFGNVKAADITDTLTIRIADVKDSQSLMQTIRSERTTTIMTSTNPKKGVLQIQALPKEEFDKQYQLSQEFRITKGVLINGWDKYDSRRTVQIRQDSINNGGTIPKTVWYEPIIGIAKGAIWTGSYTGIITIPDSVTNIEYQAINRLNDISIGANVDIASGSEGSREDIQEKYEREKWNQLVSDYNSNGRKAGIYTYDMGKAGNIGRWKYKPR